MSCAPAPFVALAELLARTRYLLLDFDGPICAIFAGRPARTIVLELLELVSAHALQIPPDVAGATDPFDVLRFAATVSPALAQQVEDELRSAEIDAARHATPTPHASALITTWQRAGRHIAVVSNNSAAAVDSYLDAHNIKPKLVVARTSADPELLKPSPHLVTTALRALGADPDGCLLVGDSPSDIHAAQAAGVAAIGYANKPGKDRRLSDAGAQVIVDDMRPLAEAAGVAFA